MGSDASAVLLEGVTKKFGAQKAVNSVDLQIPHGSIQGIIGPNGSGKTTTIRMLLRIFKPDAGVVHVLGRTSGDAADDRVGYLPEERGLYLRMKVRDVLRFFAQLKGNSRPDKAIDRWLERLGATDWSHKKLEQLSKGMAQKIQFIAAVVSQPELVILDEPFSGLDPVNLDLLRQAVLDLRKEGTTVLLSTHDMDVAERMCDRIFMIYKGNKVLDGTMEEIQSQYGEPVLRVRLAGNIVPDVSRLPDIESWVDCSPYTELRMKSLGARSSILRALMEQGDVEHFETARPRLHDIFVRIAKPSPEPTSNEQGADRS
ncbi:MAG: ATP-binding cassette domain-containing protein [Planctomycetes bacterium]|jgi:ABC-2 type transport system ATP-binding protein|nr:ATP-binding cassette domain-containing protein [Planctomycetota bacterium]